MVIKIVLFISNTREDLIDNVINKNFLMVEKIKSNNLNNFVINNGKSLSHATHLIIDLSSLNDNENEMVNSINTLNNLYTEMRVIIIADSERVPKELLIRLFDKGIYNIITTFSNEELERCISVGKTCDEVKEFLVERPDLSSEDKRKEFENLKKYQKEELYDSEEKEEKKIEVILPNKDFRKYKPYISVAVCGSESHVGTTHNALLITKFLHDIGFKVCYLEANEVQKIFYLKSFYTQNSNFNERKNLLQCFGIDIYSGFNISDVMSQNYDFYVFDLGALTETKLVSFLTKDVRIVVSGSKPWELAFLNESINLIGTKNTVNFLLNLSIKSEEMKIRSFMENLRASTFFTEYVESPFKSGVNVNIYKNVFKEYIMQEEKEVIRKRKSIFKFKK